MYVCYVSGVCQCVFYAVGKSLPVCFSVVGIAASMLYVVVVCCMWLVGYGLLGSLSECLCSVLFDLNCLLGLLLGCLYCLWWVSARVYGVH